MIQAIIVDDESSCRNVLSALLQSIAPQVKIIGTAQNVNEAVILIDELKPELVFLDVELGDELSFKIFEKVSYRQFYSIITSAHEKYAIRAFKASCLEYLLKPVDSTELAQAIVKFERQRQITFNQKKIELLLENIGSAGNAIQKIAIPCHDGYAFVNVADIIYCEADAKYTKIYTRNNEHILSSKNLGEFEELLDYNPFFRCHKSYIININFVKKFLRSDSLVEMSNGTRIDVATRKKDDFLKLFEKL